MSRKRIDVLFSALVVVFLAWAVWEARAWPLHSRIFPWSIGIAVLLLALVQLASAARGAIRTDRSGAVDAAPGPNLGRREAQGVHSPATEERALAHRLARRRVVVMCSWILVFFLGVWLLGFRVGSFVLTAAFLKSAAAEGWSVSLSAGAVSYLFFLLVFHWLLQVPLPPGALAESMEADSLDAYALRAFRDLIR